MTHTLVFTVPYTVRLFLHSSQAFLFKTMAFDKP